MNPEHREMHIGFIVVKNLLRGGGIESLTYEVGKRLVSRGHKVTVFSMGHYGEVPAMAEGMTVVDYAPDAAIAEDYMNIAGWLRGLSPAATQGLRKIRWSEQ